METLDNVYYEDDGYGLSDVFYHSQLVYCGVIEESFALYVVQTTAIIVIFWGFGHIRY